MAIQAALTGTALGTQYSAIVSLDGTITLFPVAHTINSPLISSHVISSPLISGQQPSSSSPGMDSFCPTNAVLQAELLELSSTAFGSTYSTPSPDFLQQQQPSSSTSRSPSPTLAFPQKESLERPWTVASNSSAGLDSLQQPIPSTSEAITPSPTTALKQAVLVERSSNVGSSCSTPVHTVEHQRFLSSTPVNGQSITRHFRPCDILPIPKVPQTGPRIARPNKRLQDARNLTSEPEVRKIKEAHEAKLLKKQKQEEAAKKRTMVCANSKIVFYH